METYMLKNIRLKNGTASARSVVKASRQTLRIHYHTERNKVYGRLSCRVEVNTATVPLSQSCQGARLSTEANLITEMKATFCPGLCSCAMGCKREEQ
eukprot:6208677-Pleurochrysis_carterae.AAC.3